MADPKGLINGQSWPPILIYSARSTYHVSDILLPYLFPVCRSFRRNKKRDPSCTIPLSLLRLSVRRVDPTPPVKTTYQIPLTRKRKTRNRNLHRKEREPLLPRFFFLLDFDAFRNPNFYLEFDESTDHMARIEDLREKSIFSFCFLRLSFIWSIESCSIHLNNYIPVEFPIWGTSFSILFSIFFPIWMLDCFYADSGLSAADCMLCVEW